MQQYYKNADSKHSTPVLYFDDAGQLGVFWEPKRQNPVDPIRDRAKLIDWFRNGGVIAYEGNGIQVSGIPAGLPDNLQKTYHDVWLRDDVRGDYKIIRPIYAENLYGTLHFIFPWRTITMMMDVYLALESYRSGEGNMVSISRVILGNVTTNQPETKIAVDTSEAYDADRELATWIEEHPEEAARVGISS